jgi:hypothetical protein
MLTLANERLFKIAQNSILQAQAELLGASPQIAADLKQ